MATKSAKSKRAKKSMQTLVSKSGGAKVASSFNWRTAILSIVLLAVVGGIMVYKSSANTGGTPETVTKTVTEAIPDKSRSYKTITAGSLNGQKSSATGRNYEAKVNTWSPKVPVIEGVTQVRFDWVGPENITVCATVIGAHSSTVSLQVKRLATMSSTGSGVTTRTSTFGAIDGAQKVSPSTDVKGGQISEANRLADMKRAEICTDVIKRAVYGPNIQITVTGGLFEKLDVYAVRMSKSSVRQSTSNNTQSPTEQTEGISDSEPEYSSYDNDESIPDEQDAYYTDEDTYYTDGTMPRSEDDSALMDDVSSTQQEDSNTSGMSSKRWWPF